MKKIKKSVGEDRDVEFDSRWFYWIPAVIVAFYTFLIIAGSAR